MSESRGGAGGFPELCMTTHLAARGLAGDEYSGIAHGASAANVLAAQLDGVGPGNEEV